MYLSNRMPPLATAHFIKTQPFLKWERSGGYFEDSNVTITDLFSIQMMPTILGAIRSNDSNLSISNTVFSHNRSLSSNGGGAMYLNQGSFMITVLPAHLLPTQRLMMVEQLMSSAAGSIIDSNFSDNLNSQWNGGGCSKLSLVPPSFAVACFIKIARRQIITVERSIWNHHPRK